MELLKKIFSSADSDKEVQAILAHAESLLEKNFYDWAAVEFNKALELNPKFASETVTRLFQEMQGGGNPDGIISLGVNVLQMDPKNVELANILGNTYRKKHDWKQAKNMYHYCLKHDPDFKYAFYNLAASVAKLEVADGTAVSAIDEFEKMSDFVLPDIKEGLDKLIEMQQNFVNDPEEVSEDGGAGKQEDTGEIPVDGSKEDDKTEVKADDEKDGDESSDETNKINPSQTFKYIVSNLEAESKEEKEACFTLGIYCLQQRIGDIAQRLFKRLLMREKGNVDLRCFLVLAISLDGDTNKAIKTFQGILGSNPNHRYTNVNMGILLKRKGMIQQSRVCFFTTFKLLERSKGNYDVSAILEKAEKLYEEGHEKKAIEIYEPLVPEITSEELLNKIAQYNVEKKLWDNAFEIFRRILHINRQNKEAREGIKSIHAAYLMVSGNYLKKKDPKNALLAIDKALNIAASKNLIQKAISLNRILKNENRTIELEKMLEAFKKKEIKGKVQEKISLAEEAETKGNFKEAISYYEQAIRIEPQNSTLKKLVDLCVRIKRPDLAEKVTNWFNKYQHSIEEKKKVQAREAFRQSEKNEEEFQKDGEPDSAEEVASTSSDEAESVESENEEESQQDET